MFSPLFKFSIYTLIGVFNPLQPARYMLLPGYCKVPMLHRLYSAFANYFLVIASEMPLQRLSHSQMAVSHALTKKPSQGDWSQNLFCNFLFPEDLVSNTERLVCRVDTPDVSLLEFCVHSTEFGLSLTLFESMK